MVAGESLANLVKRTSFANIFTHPNYRSNELAIGFTHSNEKPLQNNLTTLICSLVNGLYKITAESIKLVPT